VSAAVKLLSQSVADSVLLLNSEVPCGVDSSGRPAVKTVMNILSDKHPLAQPASTQSLLESDGVRAPKQ